ncbi:MAG TPA: putative Ig domain-containing protein [Opitutus sp.]|nr:putative Ig domain-containing protein [Opitutus sp.]
MPFAFALRPALRLTAFALFATLSPGLVAQSGSAAADGFDPNVTDGNVYAIEVQPDSRILIAGDFQHLQPNGGTTVYGHNRIARINPDGTTDETFRPDVNGRIWALALQSDGSVVIGGEFTAVNGATRNHVARLKANGDLDPTFDPNTGGSLTPEVMALLVQADGKILIGGGFVTVRPNGAATATTRNRIARFNADGTLDTSFDPSANNTVLAFGQADDGSLYVGGGFTTIGGVTQNRIAHLSLAGVLDTAFHPNPTGSIHAIATQHDGTVLIGGNFLKVQPNTSVDAATRSYLVRVKADGTIDTTFLGATNGPVFTLKNLPDGTTLAGGSFGSVGSGSFSYAARILPTGYSDGVFAPFPNTTVYAFGVQPDGSIILGGSFTTLHGSGVTTLVRNRIGRVDRRGSIDTDFRPDVNGRLRTLARQSDGKLLVGGNFTSVGGATHGGIVRLNTDGSVDSTFKANIPGLVIAIAPQSDGKILVGGTFNSVNSTQRSYVARLNPDGTLDTAFDLAVNNVVNSIAVQSDGKILLGGSFNTVLPHGESSTTVRYGSARFNADGTLDTTYDPETNDTVNVVCLQSDGKIILGGRFTSVQPGGATSSASQIYTRYGMVRFNSDGTIDATFNPNVNGTVYTVAVQGDGAVVFGGIFQQIAPVGVTAPVTRYDIARVTADGKLDADFNPHVNGFVLSLAVQSDQKIIVGGYFTSLQPNDGDLFTRNYVTRLKADGTVDTSFDLTLDTLGGNQVRSVLVPDADHIVIGGAFTQLTHGGQTVVRNRLARVMTDGTVDPAFNSDFGTAGGAPIESVVVNRNGHLLMTGTFADFGGTFATNVADFYPDGTPNTGLAASIDGPVHTIAQFLNKGQPTTTQSTGFAWLKTTGDLLPGFEFQSTVAAGTIRNIEVQSDGKLLIAGNFAIDQTPDDPTDYSTPVALARFNPDGTLDTTFEVMDYDNALSNVTVLTTHIQADGKILVGGTFSGTIHETTVSNLIRLNADGTLDGSFLPQPDNTVYAITQQPDGKILIGGDFLTVRPDANTTAVSDVYLARLNSDGTLDTAFKPTPNSSVYSILVKSDGKIVIGGLFSKLTPNGTSTSVDRTYMAELNADGTVTSQDFAANGSIYTLVSQADGKYLAGGYFTSIESTGRNSVARFNSDNTLDAAFNPNPNGGVPAIAVLSDGKILIGGGFTALAPNGSNVYDATTATPRNHIARLNADGTLDAAFNPSLDAAVTRVVSYLDGTILVTGSFSTIQPTGSTIVGGSFNTINGVPGKNLALFSDDGSVSSTFQPSPDGAVFAILPMTDERVVVAGAFNTLWGETRHHLGRLNDDNSLDANFDPNANGDVYAVALQSNGKLVVGGAFTAIGGGARSYLARLNTDGTIDNSFSASVTGTVRGLALQGDGKVLVLADGTGGIASVLARFDASGGADSSFVAVNGGTDRINTFVLQNDGRIVVGGDFSTIAGSGHPYLARLTSTGALDASLTAAPNGPVTALGIQPDGKIVIAGEFSAVDGLPRYGIARLAVTTPPSESFTLSTDRTVATWTRGGGGPEIYGATAEKSSDATHWTEFGTVTRIAGTSNWRISGLSPSAAGGEYVRVHALVSSATTTAVGQLERIGGFYIVPTPVIVSATAVSATAGTDFVYAIAATGEPTSFTATGLPSGLTLDANTGLITGQPTQTGTFEVTLGATNDYGAGPAGVLHLVITGTAPTPATKSKLVNISHNGQVTAGERVIAGFVIAGAGPGDTTPQSVLLRAVGPTLTHHNLGTFIPNPHLRVFSSTGQILIDKAGWDNSQAMRDTAVRLGAYPLDDGSADAAVLATLAPGVYTMHVFDDNGATGNALAEVYDASSFATDTPRLTNISGRSLVNTTSPVAIGGFVITGDTPRQVLVRGVGPGLVAQGVTNALTDPKLSLLKGSTVIATNDNWETPVTADTNYPAATSSAIVTAATTTGAFALTSGSKDAAILVTLAPGVYTVHVSSTGTATGSVLTEIYELP